MARILPVFAAVLLLTVTFPAGPAGPAAASHGGDDLVVEGHIAAGNPASGSAWGASELTWDLTNGNHAIDGADGDVVELPSWAPGHRLWVNGSSPAPYDLDVRFYNADEDIVEDTSCITPRVDENCTVPDEAAFAVVNLWSGAHVDFQLTVDADSAVTSSTNLSIPTSYTWGKQDLRVVIVPPVPGPVVYDDATVAPAGTNVGADSPYVQATKDAITAWDQALEAYAANHSDAAYLADFTFDVTVAEPGTDPATVQDADIRINYAPTGGLILGAAVYTDTTSEGQLEHCDIANSQWLIWSFTPNDMYNIHGHEFGHCLGLSHPSEPKSDLMNGVYDPAVGDPGTDRLCLSTLDLKGMAGAYAWLGEGTGWQPPSSSIELPQDDYALYPAVGSDAACPNTWSPEG